MGAFLVILIVIFLVFVVMRALEENARVEAMSPPERATYLFGSVNSFLVCPHCHTTGMVRAKQASRTDVSTGKVGGILKTDTRSQTTRVVTQHKCDQCSTQWDV